MKIRHILYSGIFLLAACGSETSAPDGILVFADGALQCEPKISIESNAQLLTAAGIEVLQSSCGVKTGVSVASVCGAPSLNILIHEIPAAKLQDAERLGFHEVGVLVDEAAGTGYELTDC